MTARARQRGWLVRGLVLVACEARRAITAWRRFVRRVAGDARRVIRDAMKPRQRRVARRASRGLHGAIGSVRAMAARAIDVAAVSLLGLVDVTGRACGWLALRIMRGVTARARRVALRRGCLLRGVACPACCRLRLRRVWSGGVAIRTGGVAGPDRGANAIEVTARAGWHRCLGLVRCLRVALRALCVSGCCRACNLRLVTTTAESAVGFGLARMRRMAVETIRGRVMRLLMTARAAHRLGR